MQIINNKIIRKCYVGDKQVVKKYIDNRLVYGISVGFTNKFPYILPIKF